MVQRYPLSVDDFKTIGLKQSLHWTERPIGNMLVIDGIESTLVEDINQVMRLENENPFGCQGDVQATDKILKFRDVRKSVGRSNGRGGAIFFYNFFRRRRVEKTNVAIDAELF